MKALGKTNPKSVTSVRNFPGRVGSGVLHVNKGLEGTRTSNYARTSIGHLKMLGGLYIKWMCAKR